jgi:hypothetical protein
MFEKPDKEAKRPKILNDYRIRAEALWGLASAILGGRMRRYN